MLSRAWMRRIASAKSAATETICTLGLSGKGWVSTVSVTITCSIGLSVRRSAAWPEKSPWVAAAQTELAPRSTSASAASISVPR